MTDEEKQGAAEQEAIQKDGQEPDQADTNKQLVAASAPENQPESQASDSEAGRSEEVEQTEDEAYQQRVRGRITALPFGLGLITLGGLLLLENFLFEVTLLFAVIIVLASLVLTFLTRFWVSGRRERGLLFLGLLLLALGGMVLLLMVSGLDVYEWWPLSLMGITLVLLMTYIADRRRERGLVGLAGISLAAGTVSFLITMDGIPQSATDTIGDYFPLIIAFIGITLIPLALRQSAQ